MTKIKMEDMNKVDMTRNKFDNDMGTGQKLTKPSIGGLGPQSPWDRMFSDFNNSFFPYTDSSWPFGRTQLVVEPNKWQVLSDDNGNVIAEIELAGFSKENLALEMSDDGLLTVTATKPNKTITKSIRFTTPSVTSYTVLKAVCEHGLLTVTVRGETKNTNKTIPIE